MRGALGQFEFSCNVEHPVDRSSADLALGVEFKREGLQARLGERLLDGLHWEEGPVAHLFGLEGQGRVLGHLDPAERAVVEAWQGGQAGVGAHGWGVRAGVLAGRWVELGLGLVAEHFGRRKREINDYVLLLVYYFICAGA